MPTSEGKNAIDVAIGQKVAEFRESREFTANHVAEMLGLSLDEYVSRENGSERFSAAQLFQIATLLNVTMAAIYQSGSELGE